MHLIVNDSFVPSTIVYHSNYLSDFPVRIPFLFWIRMKTLDNMNFVRLIFHDGKFVTEMREFLFTVRR